MLMVFSKLNLVKRVLFKRLNRLVCKLYDSRHLIVIIMTSLKLRCILTDVTDVFDLGRTAAPW